MDTPETESLSVDQISHELNDITDETTREDLYKKIDFFVTQLNRAYEINRKNVMVLTEALEKAQTLYKKYESEQDTFGKRMKSVLKKIFIARGWYEASYEELKGIHEGRVQR